MKYIHYGRRAFDPLKWEPIRNAPMERSFTKPAGGLWASPVGAERGWAEWCEREDMCTEGLSDSFEFRLSESARVLNITSAEMVKALPQVLDDPVVNALRQRAPNLFSQLSFFPIDFEQLSREYDVIAFQASGFWNPNGILPGWDCDCILVMNKDVLCEIEAE